MLHNVETRAEYNALREARKRGFDPRSRQLNSGHYAENDASINQDFDDFFNFIFGATGSRNRQHQPEARFDV